MSGRASVGRIAGAVDDLVADLAVRLRRHAQLLPAAVGATAATDRYSTVALPSDKYSPPQEGVASAARPAVSR